MRAIERVVTALGVAAVGVAVVAGCASKAQGNKSGSGGGAPDAAIQAAAQQMLSSKSVHVYGTMTADGVAVTLKGGVVFTPKLQASLTATASGTPAMTPTDGSGFTAADLPSAFVLDGSTIYEKVPSVALAMTGGKTKPWLAIPVGDNAAATPGPGMSLGSPFGKLGALDPQALVAKALATGKFTLGVQKQIDGVGATDYAGVFQDSGTPVSVDLYLDQTGLPVHVTVDEKKTTDGVVSSNHLDLLFSGWGTPVTITVPPAGQVESIEDMMKNVPTDVPSGFPTDLPSGLVTAAGSDPTGFPTGPIIIPGPGPTTCITETMPAGLPSAVPSGAPTAVTMCGPVSVVQSIAKG